MLFHNSEDESAWGLMLVAALIVTSAIILGNVTADVQPKAPYEESHPDVSAPYLGGTVSHDPEHPQNGVAPERP